MGFFSSCVQWELLLAERGLLIAVAFLVALALGREGAVVAAPGLSSTGSITGTWA